ncbi:hypothetical protein COSHB9_19650 [Companilactobacillus alimentarius]|uniref:hypothetical protein n=1 Tax=Companilactobacillus alimentarius TaxID=1602 RepID=UPI0028B59266|nr:hypothetical protein [Companilactobacillus alimentarius]MDT6951874.1 hypothetical protein [Companilactobacillus alimentarius]
MNNGSGYYGKFYFWLALIVVGLAAVYMYMSGQKPNLVEIIILVALIIGAGIVSFRK